MPERMLLRQDSAGAYRIVNDVPILMAPEMLAPRAQATPIDTTSIRTVRRMRRQTFLMLTLGTYDMKTTI